MVKPDFRAVAASRLHAERTKDLSESVLRLLRAEGTADGRPEAVADSAVEEVEVRNDRSPESRRRVQAAAARFARGAGGRKAADGSVEEIDAATGLASARAWTRVLHNEEDRFARHRRPVTIVLVELEGLDTLAARLGRETADDLIVPLAELIGRTARAGDVVARTGRTRFAGLLPETDEIVAINYVERVRCACDARLGAAAPEVGVAIGWAQPPAGGRLADALDLAADRLGADRRRSDLGPGASKQKPLPKPDLQGGSPG